jgi:hypothetical protein
LVVFFSLVFPVDLEARPPIRSAFFSKYPIAVNTQVDDLPSNSNHCGVCHFDFNGGGTRNPYGVAIEALIQLGLSNQDAMTAIENNDSDGDGVSNLIEITNALFNNTPTFPGLSNTNIGAVSNVTQGEVSLYLSPSGSADTTLPSVSLSAPNGGEFLAANSFFSVTYSATDANGIAHVNIFLSDDGGTSFKQIAAKVPHTGSISQFIPILPGSQSILRVEAVDNAGNSATDSSDAVFTISAPPGRVPSTLRDMDLPGTQPFEGAVLEDPSSHCVSCHGDYDSTNEPWETWRGSMMAQAARDPLFLACLAVAEQDAPGVGDLCIRCHSPGGWQEGRSVDTGGSLLNAKDRHSIQCDFCHRVVDFNYVPGVSPPQDVAVLNDIVPLPLQYANGQFINDPSALPRGPFDDAAANHQFAESPIHSSSNICGTCHDVSNPVFEKTGPGDYTPTAWGTEHPTMDLSDMFPIERTFSEWSVSEYATVGVFAPQFAGNKADGIVSTCEDCHMRDVNATGCNQGGTPTRADMPIHDFTGGNTFIPDILPSFFPGEVDVAALQASKQRATSMLQLAATLELTPQNYGVKVKVTNETGHKLPSGYPEGRRIWLNVVARDILGAVVFESGIYDTSTGVLTHDSQEKIYEIQPGLSPSLASALLLPAGKSFHFVLNDTVYSDNRIPPRGFTNANFDIIQSPPVAYPYADGQYWDETQYFLPGEAESVTVTLYYQTTTKEYVEFLRDENVTNSAGQDLYDAWVANGRSRPVVMAQGMAIVNVTSVGVPGEETRGFVFGMAPAQPNPFANQTRIAYSVPEKTRVRLVVFDVSGRRVRTLIDRVQAPMQYEVLWDGHGDGGEGLAAGLYFIHLRVGIEKQTRKVVLAK